MYVKNYINPLNAELNPIFQLLILLGDLTFIGPCIVSISNKKQRYTVYLYLKTALHVSGGTSTHHQERIQLYLQHLVFITPLLLSAAIVEELEPVWVCCGWRTLFPARCRFFLLVRNLRFDKLPIPFIHFLCDVSCDDTVLWHNVEKQVRKYSQKLTNSVWFGEYL
jgi:hypothetical protein